MRKKVSLENLKHAFPEMSKSQRNRIAYFSLRNFFLTTIEAMWVNNLSEADLDGMVKVEDGALLDDFISESEGKILLSAHFGNWEYLAQYFGIRYKMKYPAIAKKMRNPLVDKYITTCRNRFGYMYPLYMDKNMKEVIKILNSGKPMLLLADQSAPQESMYINFFNRPATTFQGPAVFALKCNAKMRLVLMIRERDDKLRLIHEEIRTDDLNKASDDNIYELSKRHVELLEKYIRKYPEQWLWSHRRWKHSDKYEIFGKRNKSARTN